MTLLAKSAIGPEDAQNPIRHLGLERGFPPSIAAQTTASEFANSVVLWRDPLLYLLVNDGYRMVTFGGRLRLCGPELSDVAVLTMEIFGEQQGRHDDASIHRYFDGHWRHFFPNLGSYQAFARRCAALSVMGGRMPGT